MKKTNLLTVLFALLSAPIFAGALLTPNGDGTYSIKTKTSLYEIEKDKFFEKNETDFGLEFKINVIPHESYISLTEEDPIIDFSIYIRNKKIERGTKDYASSWTIKKVNEDKSIDTYQTKKYHLQKGTEYLDFSMRKSAMEKLFGACKEWILSNSGSKRVYKFKKEFKPHYILSSIKSIEKSCEKKEAKILKSVEIEKVQMFNSPYKYEDNPKAITTVKPLSKVTDIIEVYDYKVILKDKSGNIKNTWVVIGSMENIYGFTCSFDNNELLTNKSNVFGWTIKRNIDGKIYEEVTKVKKIQ